MGTIKVSKITAKYFLKIVNCLILQELALYVFQGSNLIKGIVLRQ